jgi:hypothetical protein
MKTTTKTLLVTLLLFFITTGIMAQEKYEYAQMSQHLGSIYLITHSGEEKFPIEKGTGWEYAAIKKNRGNE